MFPESLQSEVMNDSLRRMFDSLVTEAESTPFSGWDFGYITKTHRMVESPVKWNYYNIVLPKLRESKSLLDIGTGGGEVLSRFVPLPPVTYATEQYEPNVAVAQERLGPLGVKVVQIDERYPNNEVLPFQDQMFDLIINRHESYHPPELMRILKPKGLFVTQQVGQGLWNLKELLTGKKSVESDWTLETLVGRLKSVGFQILDAREDMQLIRLYDIGAIAYWLKAIPWIIEDVTGVQDFTVERYRDRLWELHRQIEKEGFFDCSYALFIIAAER
jgi:SAM-dependent methyltransferase